MAKVYISPSTQEHNLYVNGNTEEYWMNKVADVTCDLLIKSGVTVYRNKPTMTLEQVVADSNAKQPDIHVAIHSNAGGGRGCEAYAWFVSDGKGGYKKDTPGRRLAQAIYDEVSRITPTADRGVKNGNHLYEIKHTAVPAALVEIAFHDNPADAAWIKANIENIGKAIAQGICDYFGVPLKEPKPPEETAPNGKLYRVQIGAFKYKAGADAMLKRIKDAGLDGFIKLE